MLWIKIKSPFWSISYNIKRYFEIKYWYWWRDTTRMWFNDETNKWEKGSKMTAKDTIRCWWGAEADLLDIMLLKIDHMYYKIKKDGHHLWQYLDSYIFNEDYITPSDKEWALKKSLKTLMDPKLAKNDYRVTVIKDKHVTKLYRWIGNIEEFDCNTLDKLEGKLAVGKPLTDDEVVKLEELREARKNARSESGLIHYELVHIIPKNKQDKDSYVIEESVDRMVPYKNPKKAAYYTFDEEKKGITKVATSVKERFNNLFLPTPSYRRKESKDVLVFDNFESLSKVDQLIEEKLGIKLNVEANFIMDEQTLIVENSDFLILSPKVCAEVRGRRKDLIRILQVRRAIKKIRDHDDYDDKYNTWMYNEFDTEEDKRKDMKRCRDLYNEDRRKLYHSLADILAEHGETFWD